MDYYQGKGGVDNLQQSNSIENIDQITFQQIESLIQQQYGAIVPAIVFEYVSFGLGKDITGFDYDDLLNFFGSFGEVEALDINGKVSFVLFKTFFDANTAREFLQNEGNFKENVKTNFRVRWYKQEDEMMIYDEEIKGKFAQYTQKIQDANGMNGNGNESGDKLMGVGGQGQYGMTNVNIMGLNPILGPTVQNMNMCTYNYPNQGMIMPQNIPPMNMNQYSYPYFMGRYSNMQMNGMGTVNSNNMRNGMNVVNGMGMNLSHQTSPGGNIQTGTSLSSNKSISYVSENSDDKKLTSNSQPNGISTPIQNGKFTCRFEIQIENDKDFQVARRLIGAKGCNMKKIVEMCSKNSDGTTMLESVKLRLRGRGSGYKEGPFNKESDEPLHLCISSKFLDKYKTACHLVNELISTVFEEYKKYCERTNRVPVPCLAIRKEEGISSRKGALSKVDYDM